MYSDQAMTWVEEYKWGVVLALCGLMFVGVGLFLFKTDLKSDTKVEVLSSGNQSNPSKSIYIDISGSVNSPGVYELELGSRVEDAITVAGGVADTADLDWIAANLNRAQVLVDGAKVYIPNRQKPGLNTSVKNAYEKVSINSASRSELESLSGIGPVTAEKIISNRPYQALEDLLIKKVLGQKLFDSLKNQLSLW